MKRAWWYYLPHFLLGTGVLWLCWRLRLVLAPFIIAYLLAALLDPVVDAIERRGCRRSWAVFAIFFVFLVLLGVGLLKVVPAAVNETLQFAKNVPGYVQKAPALIDAVEQHLGSPAVPQYLRDTITEHAGQITEKVAAQVVEWAQGVLQSVGFLVWLLIIPIATFYLLNDIDRIRARFLQLVPEQHRDTAQGIARDVAVVFLAYLRGLGTIALLNGIAMLIVLLACRVPYALALGIMAGVLYPVPILGPVITTVTFFIVATVTRGWSVGAIAGAAPVLANIACDNWLSPRIIGKSVGLHPVLSMLALLIGADLFGLVGMIIAFPVAGALQVVALRLLPRLRPAPEPLPEAVAPPAKPVRAVAAAASPKPTPAPASVPDKPPRPRATGKRRAT